MVTIWNEIYIEIKENNNKYANKTKLQDKHKSKYICFFILVNNIKIASVTISGCRNPGLN